MMRKMGYALALTAAIAVVALQGYDFTARPVLNERILAHQSVADRLGDGAPLPSRIVARLSSLPQDIINWIAPAAKAQNVPQQDITNPVVRGHMSMAQQSRIAAASATITSGSTDFRWEFTAPTAMAPVLTFGSAYLSAPICTITRSDGGSTVFLSYTISTTAITFANVTTGAGVKINGICIGVMQ